MQRYTYKIVPAPERARKFKGARTPEARFASTVEADLNTLAADGWEFLRTEVFSTEEKSGFRKKKTVERQVMVFRKLLAAPEQILALTDPVAQPEEAPVAPAPVDTPPPTLRAVETTAPPPEPQRSHNRLDRPIPPISRPLRSEDSLAE
ncbi:MAG: DUF4177 domain-containing protein [Pseudomonadota bacterium]